MDFSLPEKQIFTTSRKYDYSFIHIPKQGQEHTLLFLHGWPSHMDDWIHQIRFFSSRGYGLLVPDCLGYGDSSKPSDPREYSLKLVSQDLAELLDHVKLDKVVGVGHDWGSFILSRFAIHQCSRLLAVAFIAVVFSPPATPFDVDVANAAMSQATGNEILGHVVYISREPTAQHTMEQQAESLMSLCFTSDHSAKLIHFHRVGGLKKYLETGSRLPIAEWFPMELQKRHLENFGRKDGQLGPVGYYKLWDDNLWLSDEENLKDFKIKQRTLFVASEGPAAEIQTQRLLSWASEVEVVTVDAGHWPQLEKPGEVSRAIEKLVESLA